MEFNFCRRCGEAVEQKSIHHWKCPNNHSTYLNPAPASGVFFLTENNEVIISRRAIDPGKGFLDSIGGFVDNDESAEQAIEREIREESGLTPNDYGELHIFCTAPTGYEFEGEVKRVLSTFFWARLNVDAKPVPSDDVSEIITMPIEDIDVTKFYGEDVKIALVKLKRLILNNEV